MISRLIKSMYLLFYGCIIYAHINQVKDFLSINDASCVVISINSWYFQKPL